MKKGFMVVLLVLLAGAMVFAATLADVQPAGIDLTLKIGADTQVAWVKDENAPTLETWDTVSKATENEDIEITTKDSTVTLWAAVKTNEVANIKMEVSGEPMAADDTSTKISINAKGEEGGFGSDGVTWEDGTSNNTLIKAEGAEKSGGRVLAYKVIFSIDGDSYDKAAASEKYSANITLTVTNDN